MFKRVPLLVTVALAPIPFGPADITSLALWCCVLGIGIGFLDVSNLRVAHLYAAVPVLVSFLAFWLVVWLQSQPNPVFGHENSVWHQVAELLGRSLEPRISVEAYPQWIVIGPSLALFLVFTSAFVVSTDRRGAWQIIHTVALSGTVYAIVALGAMLYSQGGQLLSDQPGHLGTLAGPFVNRNTAATYFGTITLVWMLLVLKALKHRLGRASSDPSQLGRALLIGGHDKLAFRASAFLICFTATFLTQSRAGVLVMLGVLSLGVGLFAFRWFSTPKLPLVVGSVLLVVAVGAEIWGGSLAGRIASQGWMDRDRAAAYEATWAIIRDHPLVGTGLGTFAEVFPSYRASQSDIGIWTRAHSTPLELAAELGLPLAVTVGLLWSLTAIYLTRGALTRRRDAVLPLAGLGVGLQGTVHSFVDFSLQIPGYAIVWCAVVAAGLAQSVASHRGRGDPSLHSRHSDIA
jgi:O-antigen ligase